MFILKVLNSYRDTLGFGWMEVNLPEHCLILNFSSSPCIVPQRVSSCALVSLSVVFCYLLFKACRLDSEREVVWEFILHVLNKPVLGMYLISGLGKGYVSRFCLYPSCITDPVYNNPVPPWLVSLWLLSPRCSEFSPVPQGSRASCAFPPQIKAFPPTGDRSDGSNWSFLLFPQNHSTTLLGLQHDGPTQEIFPIFSVNTCWGCGKSLNEMQTPQTLWPQGFHTCLSSHIQSSNNLSTILVELFLLVSSGVHPQWVLCILFLPAELSLLRFGTCCLLCHLSSLIVCTKFDVNPVTFLLRMRGFSSSSLHHRAKPFPFILMAKLYYVEWMCNIPYLTNLDPLLFCY